MDPEVQQEYETVPKITAEDVGTPFYTHSRALMQVFHNKSIGLHGFQKFGEGEGIMMQALRDRIGEFGAAAKSSPSCAQCGSHENVQLACFAIHDTCRERHQDALRYESLATTHSWMHQFYARMHDVHDPAADMHMTRIDYIVVIMIFVWTSKWDCPLAVPFCISLGLVTGKSLKVPGKPVKRPASALDDETHTEPGEKEVQRSLQPAQPVSDDMVQHAIHSHMPPEKRCVYLLPLLGHLALRLLWDIHTTL